MRRITRYVLIELIKGFLAGLISLTLIVLVGVVVREAVCQSLPPSRILALVPYVLPEALRITIPVTLLLATTSVYARMSGSNEVLAVKSLGISPTVLLGPVVVLAFLLSLVTVWLNDLAVSWGRAGAERVVIESVEEIAYAMLRTHRRYHTPRFSIIVRDVEGRRLIRPTVSIRQGGHGPAITISAEEAELRSDRQRGVLTVIYRNGKIQTGRKVAVLDPGSQRYEIPLREASRAKNTARRPSSIALREIPSEIADTRALTASLQWRLATRAGYALLAGNFPGPSGREWQTRHTQLAELQSRLHRLHTEPHRRWSAGFSCLCFAWVGAPMAIRLGNRDFLTSFFLCFLPVLVVYYPLLMYGIDGAKSGALPPLTVWTGNLLLGFWGLWLLRRVMRY